MLVKPVLLTGIIDKGDHQKIHFRLDLSRMSFLKTKKALLVINIFDFSM